MAKERRVYTCSSCAATTLQWQGQCPDCGAWGSLEESRAGGGRTPVDRSAAADPQPLGAVALEDEDRLSTGVGELDRVLGGGLVPGSATLLGGDPGIGKSTLLLQTLGRMAHGSEVLYTSGEESLRQISLRARRLGLGDSPVQLLAETRLETILATAEARRPKVLVVDSIQTVHSEALESAPGAVGQLRECANRLVRFAKASEIAVVMVGHVTKEGVIAGPRVLEHVVDTVLYFESDAGSRFRVVRAVKNRFGAVNEIGVFAMADDGLREVRNPSAIFLSRHDEPVAGSVVMVTWEGSRPLLVEVQALVDASHSNHPKRVTVGLEGNRLAMLLAVLHRHAGIAMYDQDVFSNVVGGVRVSETAADLPLLLAALSSLRDRPFPADTVVMGEVGLSGEIRPVPYGEERLREAAKHGFGRAILPRSNAPKRRIDGIEVVSVRRLSEAVDACG